MCEVSFCRKGVGAVGLLEENGFVFYAYGLVLLLYVMVVINLSGSNSPSPPLADIVLFRLSLLSLLSFPSRF